MRVRDYLTQVRQGQIDLEDFIGRTIEKIERIREKYSQFISYKYLKIKHLVLKKEIFLDFRIHFGYHNHIVKKILDSFVFVERANE